MSEWIDIKDRKPLKGEVIARFIHESRQRIETVIYDEHGFTFQNVPIDLLVTHWMPIQEPQHE